MNNIKIIIENILKIIKEDLGKTKKTSIGFGTSQGYTIGADRPSLGYVENDVEIESESPDPVKISRAFTKNT